MVDACVDGSAGPLLHSLRLIRKQEKEGKLFKKKKCVLEGLTSFVSVFFYLLVCSFAFYFSFYRSMAISIFSMWFV